MDKNKKGPLTVTLFCFIWRDVNEQRELRRPDET